MTEMSIEDYLAHGGKLTSPGNVPARYRGELLRLMASFVDSELAASAGFADSINDAPGIKSRIAAAKITLEKADHAERVLRLMAEFGVDTDRYEGVHPWADRLPRDADIGATRRDGDMRLSVFHYPLQGWIDAVVMNVLQGLAAKVQLTELSQVSYQPLAEVFRAIAPVEARHAELGIEGLTQITRTEGGRAAAEASLAYWLPRVAAGFGAANSARFERLSRLGLRHRTNAAMLAEWEAEIAALRTDLTL
ncbi:Phenylacetic acid catabolic protein [Pararhodobacter aggregans]|uniref:Phenylacetic acid catabolic n=1 Tax=Pararhodobacter aggregans TaxID=404875 RepID=A0A2T7UWF5_9RHOB|nr:Phenylacetic acid catabolic protein [Pararhodobacter aggregans]PTW99584.1 1,2-phenylacetyl-CoA epoxidase catalytic subunit [Pararhodobacter aggregans]PVE48911.1 phenylacetic acid catabolic [Pararhodobacter aggregans]